MSNSLLFVSIGFSLVIIIALLYLLRKNKVNIKYSLIWLLLFMLIILVSVIPFLLESLTSLLGFQTPSNMIISLLLAVLVVINISLTVIVSSHDKKIRLLVQEISLLKEKLNGKKK